jgi:hypothetical protein
MFQLCGHATFQRDCFVTFPLKKAFTLRPKREERRTHAIFANLRDVAAISQLPHALSRCVDRPFPEEAAMNLLGRQPAGRRETTQEIFTAWG